MGSWARGGCTGSTAAREKQDRDGRAEKRRLRTRESSLFLEVRERERGESARHKKRIASRSSKEGEKNGEACSPGDQRSDRAHVRTSKSRMPASQARRVAHTRAGMSISVSHCLLISKFIYFLSLSPSLSSLFAYSPYSLLSLSSHFDRCRTPAINRSTCRVIFGQRNATISVVRVTLIFLFSRLFLCTSVIAFGEMKNYHQSKFVSLA